MKKEIDANKQKLLEKLEKMRSGKVFPPLLKTKMISF